MYDHVWFMYVCLIFIHVYTTWIVTHLYMSKDEAQSLQSEDVSWLACLRTLRHPSRQNPRIPGTREKTTQTEVCDSGGFNEAPFFWDIAICVAVEKFESAISWQSQKL